MEGIQVCLNEGPHPFPREDNSKNIKIILKTVKIFSLEPLGQFQPNLAQGMHAWVVVIQVCSNERPHPSPSGYNIENS